jgi:putative hydroxymethylpyrimidine transport system substrate-binding protein
MIGVVGASVMALALAACGSSSSEAPVTPGGSSTPSGSTAPAMRDITVLLDWFPNPDHVALYMAQDKGYFTEAGLNVKLQAPSDPSDPPKLVSTGKVELGISYEPEMYFSHQAGLKVTAVGSLIPTALNSVMATKNSPVKSLADLGGKTIGDAGLPTDAAFLQAIYAANNIDPNSVKEINLKTSLVSAMLSGKVDATIGAYRNIEGVQLQMEGQDPMIVPISEAGVPDYNELVVIANTDRLASDDAYGQIVRDFLSALAKGSAAAQADPAAAEASMAKVAKGYDSDQLAKMIDATTPLLKNSLGDLQMDAAQWTSFGDWMYENKLIDAKVDASAVMTTDFLPTS